MSVDEHERKRAPGQFYAVMAFLDRHGYVIRNRDGDYAYHGGHTQRILAERYDEERDRGR